MRDPIKAAPRSRFLTGEPSDLSDGLETPDTLSFFRGQVVLAAEQASSQGLSLALAILLSFPARATADAPRKPDEPLADLTVEQVADLYGRTPQAVRSWIRNGRLAAYKLNGREYRSTREALEDFRKKRQKKTAHRLCKRKSVDLGAWRRLNTEGESVANA